jgi:two-component system, OmpR family, KDP operon response regulator KdpE
MHRTAASLLLPGPRSGPVPQLAFRRAPEPIVRVGEFALESRKRRLHSRSGVQPLSPMQCAVLQALMANAGDLLERDELVRAVAARTGRTISSACINVYVHGLRRKLETDPAHPRHIITVVGRGHFFQA